MANSFPMGASLTFTYMGDKITAADATEWLAPTPTAPFAYDSSYSATPTTLLSPHALMSGPNAGLWPANGSTSSLAYKASGTLYCYTGGGYTIANYAEGDATNGYIYYTSTNGGAAWTRRTHPNTKAYTIAYTASLFVGFAISSTTNGVIYGTDAVSWTSVTGISQTTVSDIVSDGGNNIVIYPISGVVANSSVLAATVWASATITAPGLSAQGLNQGGCTYNAGAGLFIGNVGTAGQYQTSPTGLTWTLRNTIVTYQPYGTLFGTTCRYASNATVTVAMAANGYFAVTTDGLVWTGHNFIVGTGPTTSLISAIYYDGTRFVATGPTRIFYSTNGTTWTEGRPSFATAGGILTANDRMLRLANTNTNAQTKALLVTDPTATTAQTVAGLTQSTAQAAVNSYIRIR